MKKAQVKLDKNGWTIYMDDVPVDLFGTKWLPLPLTAEATIEDVHNYVVNVMQEGFTEVERWYY